PWPESRMDCQSGRPSLQISKHCRELVPPRSAHYRNIVVLVEFTFSGKELHEFAGASPPTMCATNRLDELFGALHRRHSVIPYFSLAWDYSLPELPVAQCLRWRAPVRFLSSPRIPDFRIASNTRCTFRQVADQSSLVGLNRSHSRSPISCAFRPC